MKHIRIILLALLIAFVLFGIFVEVMHFIGYDMRYVRRFDEIGILSDSGKYRLVEMSDPSGKYPVYSVIRLRSDFTDDESNAYPQTLYVAHDLWYHSRYADGYGWIEGTDDFYIDSSDTGRHCYFFNGETWVPEY